MISLIVATLGRSQEVEALLLSLRRQVFRDFEVVLVDQNEGDLLAPIVAGFRDLPALTWLRETRAGQSRARNTGIARARGDILAFPDDDCLYPPDLLARVAGRFASEPDLDLLSGPAIGPDGRLSSGRWTRRSGPIRPATVWTSVIAFNMFIRKTALDRSGGFDEELGVGARFGSAEETDLAIRVMQRGRAEYDYELRAVHPHKPAMTARAYAYGRGLGRVLRRRGANPATVATFLIRPLGGMVVSLIRGHPGSAKYYWKTCLGRISGYGSS